MKVDQNPASIFLKLADENLKIYFHRPSSSLFFFQIYRFFHRKSNIYAKEKKVEEKEKRRKEKKKKVGHGEN